MADYKIAVEKRKINEFREKLTRFSDEGLTVYSKNDSKESAYIRKEKQKKLLKMEKEKKNAQENIWSQPEKDGPKKNRFLISGISADWKKF